MTLQQKINLAKEIWNSINEMPKYIPGFMVPLNWNPSLIYNGEMTKSQMNKELGEYITNYSNYIAIERLLKNNLAI